MSRLTDPMWEDTPLHDPTIVQIAEVRAANNKLWMRLLDIAIKHAPDEAKTVLKAINHNDRAIGLLLEDLTK